MPLIETVVPPREVGIFPVIGSGVEATPGVGPRFEPKIVVREPATDPAGSMLAALKNVFGERLVCPR